MGENLRVFSLVLKVSGVLNLCAVVWTLFYRWQEYLYTGEMCREGVEETTVFVCKA